MLVTTDFGCVNIRMFFFWTFELSTHSWYVLQGIAKRLVKAALQVAAKKRELRYSDIKDIERGIRRHFHDDISVVVLYLDQHKSNGSNARFKSSAVSYTNAPADIYSFNSDST